MRQPSSRHFTISDAMIAIALMAAGIGLARGFWSMPRSTGSRPWDRILGPLSGLVGLATLALLGYQLRRPRPPLRRLARQPGFVACAAAAAAGFVDLALNLVGTLLEERTTFWGPIHAFWGVQKIGPAVAGAWLALALGRSWRPEPDWPDRAGRAIGIYWIGLLLLGWVLLVI